MATAPAQSIDFNALTAAYVRIRDTKREKVKELETMTADFDSKLEKLEAVMLQYLTKHEVDNMKTAAGTFYRQINIMPMIADDATFYGWVHENGLAADALERRVKKGFVTEYMETHENNLPPPGVSVSKEWVVRVRKA